MKIAPFACNKVGRLVHGWNFSSWGLGCLPFSKFARYGVAIAVCGTGYVEARLKHACIETGRAISGTQDSLGSQHAVSAIDGDGDLVATMADKQVTGCVVEL